MELAQSFIRWQSGDVLVLELVGELVPAFLDAGFTNFIFAFPNRGNSIYHGLATEVTRRFSRGLMFNGAYTWSHNIDDSTADLFSTLLHPRRPQNFHDTRAERATSGSGSSPPVHVELGL